MTLEHFAHIVAHDLKAPLNGIASIVDFVVEDYGDRLDDAGREQLQLMQELAGRGVRMIDGLRRYSRIAEASCHPRTLDIGALAARAVAQASTRVAGVAVVPEIADDLPRVTGDPALVADLLTELAANAVLFHRGPERPVRVTALPSPDRPLPAGHVAVAVADTGIGIEARFQASIFDMFKRLHPPGAFGGGIGAGLAVARAIVARHGGDLWVAESDAAGTTMAFTLPAAPAPSKE